MHVKFSNKTLYNGFSSSLSVAALIKSLNLHGRYRQHATGKHRAYTTFPVAMRGSFILAGRGKNIHRPLKRLTNFRYGQLYMFRTVPLSTIRRFSLYTQQWYM